jgi:hypothetical protein
MITASTIYYPMPVNFKVAGSFASSYNLNWCGTTRFGLARLKQVNSKQLIGILPEAG